jgi:hypothetical protein
MVIKGRKYQISFQLFNISFRKTNYIKLYFKWFNFYIKRLDACVIKKKNLKKSDITRKWL